MDKTDEQQRPVLVNPVLVYGYLRLKKASYQETRDSLIATFGDSEFGHAKDALWQHLQDEKGDCKRFLGEKHKRKNSTARTATQADCEDILKALSTLEKSGKMPPLAISADELLFLPPVMPQLIHSKRHSLALEDVQEQVRLSREDMKRSLASFHEAQEKMATELLQLRTRLDEPHNLDSIAASVKPPSLMQVMPPAQPDVAPNRTYANVTTTRPSGRENDPPAKFRQDWTKVKRRKVKVITGTQTGGDQGRFLGSPPVSSLFVFRVQKGATVADLRQWLENSKKVNVVAIRLMSHPDAALSSFKVTVVKESVKDVLQADFGWPENVKVRRFTPTRA